jgi:hypothetical protein
MKKYIPIVAIAVAVALGVTLMVLSTYKSVDIVQQAPIKFDKLIDENDTRVVQFLQLCSGLHIPSTPTPSDMNFPEITIAVAHCIGRVQGLVDGHQITVAYQKQQNKPNIEHLWCVNPTTAGGALLESVFNWSDANPLEFDQIANRYTGTSAATAIIIRAISTTYPCKSI